MTGRHRAVGQAPSSRPSEPPVGRSFFDVLRESISDPDVIAAAAKAERDMRRPAADPPKPARTT